MKKVYVISLLALGVLMFSCSKPKIKIACVGDSITEGFGLANQSKTAYPVLLDSILGSKYTVLNSGRSGATVQKSGNRPFWNCKEFSNVFTYEPDIIIIKLGTNDTKPFNWNSENFEKDYQALIDTFKTLANQPKLYLCQPVPVFKTNWGINDSTVVNGILPVVGKMSKSNDLPVIDLYHEMLGEGTNFPDGVHPNEAAIKVMTGIIASEIRNVE